MFIKAVKTAANVTIYAIVALPLFLGWLVGLIVLSFRAGFASAIKTLAVWGK